MTNKAAANTPHLHLRKSADAELADLTTRGMPGGVIEVAASLLGGLPLPSAADPPHSGSTTTAETLAELLLAPRRLDPDWPAARPPVAVGESWVHLEVVDADLSVVESLLEQHGKEDAEVFSNRCQSMRLPVCPYRRPDLNRSAEKKQTAGLDAQVVGRFDLSAELTGKLVVDMTSHWAGPLGTKLLAEAGATVIKIDPDCRPDGFRDRPAVYDHLNGGKDIISLDLRLHPDRSRFEKLLASADLLVESFSRRVMTNLGYGWQQLKRISPTLSLLSVKAFPDEGQHAEWLGYGPGVHAAAGLATWSEGPVDGCPTEQQIGAVPTATPIAYPDFLTGVAAYTNASALLTKSSPAGGIRKEVAMFTVISPLRATDPGELPTNSNLVS